MPRKRMIDPGIWESEQVMGLTERQFKLYVYLISHADDEGRVKLSFAMLGARAFPMSPVSAEQVRDDIMCFHDSGLVHVYGNEQYLCHPNWTRYQTINRPTPSRIPAPDAVDEDSCATHGGLSEDSVSAHGGLTPKRREEKRREQNTREDARAREASTNAVVPWQAGSIQESTWVAFEQQYGNIIPDRQKNLDAVHQLVKLARERGDPDVILPGMLDTFWRLKDGGDAWWRKWPFVPKSLVSCWARVWEEAKNLHEQNETARKADADLDDVFGAKEDGDGF